MDAKMSDLLELVGIDPTTMIAPTGGGSSNQLGNTGMIQHSGGLTSPTGGNGGLFGSALPPGSGQVSGHHDSMPSMEGEMTYASGDGTGQLTMAHAANAAPFVPSSGDPLMVVSGGFGTMGNAAAHGGLMDVGMHHTPSGGLDSVVGNANSYGLSAQEGVGMSPGMVEAPSTGGAHASEQLPLGSSTTGESSTPHTGPGWMNRQLGPLSLSFSKITGLCFDTNSELLWIVDQFGYLLGFTPQITKTCEWQPYSRVRVVDSARCVGCSAGVVAVAGSHQILVQHPGGARLATHNGVQGGTVVGAHQSHQFVFTQDNVNGLCRFTANHPEDVHPVLANDAVSTTALSCGVSRYLVAGKALGEVAVHDARADSLPVVATIRQHFSGRVAAVSGPSLVSTSGTAPYQIVAAGTPDRRTGLTTLKVFDLRDTSEPLSVCSVGGDVTHISMYETGAMDCEESTAASAPMSQVVALTAAGYFVWATDANDKIVAQIPVDGSMACTALAVGVDERCMCIGTDSTAIFSFSDSCTGHDFYNKSEQQLPAQATQIPTWNIPPWNEDALDNLVTLGYDSAAEAAATTRLEEAEDAYRTRICGLASEAVYHLKATTDVADATKGVLEAAMGVCTPPASPVSQTAQSLALANVAVDPVYELSQALAEGVVAADGQGMASNWPAGHTMMLAVEGKPLAVSEHVKNQASERKIPQHMFPNRGNTFLPNAKDKLGHFIPNPYPFQEALGDDPSTVAQQMLVLRRLRKQQQKNEGGQSRTHLYSRCDDALQCMYPGLTHHQPDWKQFNMSSDMVGLDNSLPESWINAVLQMLYTLGHPHFLIRKALIKHIDKKDGGIASELGLLFYNMQMQSSHNKDQPIMQPTNLFRALRRCPEVIQSRVLEPPTDRDDAVAKCHTMVKILLQQIDMDLHYAQKNPINEEKTVNGDFDMTAVFGTQLQIVSTKAAVPPRFYWEVPASASKVDEGLQHLLKQLESTRGEQVNIRYLPMVLVLLLNPEHGNLRPPPNLTFSRQQEKYNYVIMSNVVHLADDADDPGFFVLHNRVQNSPGDVKLGVKNDDEWTCFNDYIISAPCAREEDLEIQIPASGTHATVVACYILDSYLRQKPVEERHAAACEQIGSVLNSDFGVDEMMKRRPADAPLPVAPRYVHPIDSIDEINSSDIIAIDAEYVVPSWGNEQRQGEPDWIRPQRKQFMMLARVSCILSRESGHEQTIIDDYIATDELIEDYVTPFSGIHEGDLDPRISPHRLTTLKACVMKLRCLADRGARFLGHGLAQDFRVINLAIPVFRRVDTLLLFHSKGRRPLSLKFLAFHLLSESVQQGCHDSIEDARTALRLYRKYQDLIAQKTFGQAMEHLHEVGAATNWYVPTAKAVERPRSVEPPPSAGHCNTITDSSNDSTTTSESRDEEPKQHP